MHPERKAGVKAVPERALGLWTGLSTARLPRSPQCAPPALAASQRWARSSKVLSKTSGCHQGRRVFQATCDQLFIRRANISPPPRPEGRSQSPELSKPSFSDGDEATSPYCGLGSVQRTSLAGLRSRNPDWSRENFIGKKKKKKPTSFILNDTFHLIWSETFHFEL